MRGANPDQAIRVSRSRSDRYYSIAAILLGIVFCTGCTATSPRFTSHRQQSPAPQMHPAAAGDTVADAADAGDDSPDSMDVAGAEMDTVAAVPAIRARMLDTAETNPAIDRRKMLSRIMELMGTRYARRGNGGRGFDCSGFTSLIYRDEAGISLPRSSREQYGVGSDVDRDSLKFGDLVFFRNRGRRPSHVGIYVGDGLFAHASLSIGVTVSLLSSGYYTKRYLGARRIVE